MKITLVIDVYLDESWSETEEDIQWLLNDVIDKDKLILHSNEIDDAVGKITDISVSYIKH